MRRRLLALTFAAGLLIPISASASGNDMIAGGCSTRASCTQKIMASDLRSVYVSHGFDAASFKRSAVAGTVTKSGDVIVGGKVVATGAQSFGRQFIAGSTQAGPVFQRHTSVVFRSDSLAAFVMIPNGHFQFAILTSCGNLVTAVAKPVVQPAAKPVATPAPAPAPAPAVINVTQSQVQTQTQSQPPATPAPVAAATPAPAPAATLPQTGANLLGLVGLSAVATLIWYYYRGRRDLRLALRRVSLSRSHTS